MAKGPKKSEEELKKEQEAAKAQLDALLQQSKPKNLRQGVGQGVNNIVSGAVGACGVAVLAPTVGLAAGLKRGGLIGGAVGVTGGAVVGVLGAVGMAVGGALSGVTQVVRGVAAAPEAMTATRKGKWWNEATHTWTYTDLTEVEIHESDDDILGGLEAELDDAAAGAGTGNKTVKDTYYYDVLGVDPQAESGAIKRKYYILAREFHPDRNESPEAADKFKEVAEAYQVLSDPELREKYNQDGKDALTGDKTGTNDDGRPDPAILMAFLFGSDQFSDYFGRMAASTSAMLGDSTKLSVQDARKLQERRVIRLAMTLVKKIEPWVQAEDYDLCKVQWKTEGETLVSASYGWQLLQALGMAYEVAALQFLGSTESGLGMPKIAEWAKGQQARNKGKSAARKNQAQTMMASLDAVKIQMDYQQKLSEAKTDEEKNQLEREMEDALQEITLKVIWTTTVVDITSTVHETCQMVFFDQSVSQEIRVKRAHAVKNLGLIFQSIPEPTVNDTSKKTARDMFEEAALAATIETMKRKDEAAHQATYGS